MVARAADGRGADAAREPRGNVGDPRGKNVGTCFLKCRKTCVTTLQYLLQRLTVSPAFQQASALSSTSVFSCRRSHDRHACRSCSRFPRACIVPQIRSRFNTCSYEINHCWLLPMYALAHPSHAYQL